PSPFLLVDAATGRVVHGNEAARAAGLFPPAAGAFATHEGGDRIAPDRLAALAGGGGGAGGAEITWHTPQHQAVFRVFARPLPPLAGSSPLTALAFWDVTGEKKAEDELRQALEARDEFFSVATHELKGPLFSLQLSIQ